MTDQQTERTSHRIPWRRKFVYLAVFLYLLSVLADFVGWQQRAWFLSGLAGYCIVFAVIAFIHDRYYFNETGEERGNGA